jgi:tetratricopeptide (TPR) repeat protein
MQAYTKFFLVIVLQIFACGMCGAQQTVFELLKSDEKRADQLFTARNYQEASKLYSIAAKKEKRSGEIYLKLARTNFYLKNFQAAINNFDFYLSVKHALEKEDVLLLGEAYTSLGNYEKAIETFRAYLAKSGEDPLIMKKIWRLKIR